MSIWHSLRDRLRGRLGRLRATPTPRRAQSNPAAMGSADSRSPTRVLKVGSHRIAFGLTWQPHAGLEFPKQLAHLKSQGFKAYALSVPTDLVGVADVPIRGKTAAAALVLADRHSKGGSELFVFRMDSTCVLLALSDGLPVPGFDLVGLKSAIASAAELFQHIKSGQPVRIAGNVDWIADIERLTPEQAFSDFDNHVRLHRMQDWRALLKGALAVLAPLCLVGTVSYLWYESEQERLALASQVPTDPNLDYEQALGQALLRVAPTGSGVLQQWTATVKALPFSLAGWTLKSVKCLPDACKAEWQRQYGNYADFSRAVEAHLRTSVVMTPTKDLGDAGVSTLHPIELLQIQRLRKDRLPTSQEAQQIWGGTLQDLLLLGANKAMLGDFKLFGANAPSPAGLRSPVFRADFRLETGLWLLDEIELPAYVAPESLEIHISFDGSLGTREVKHGSFILSGAVFANANKR